MAKQPANNLNISINSVALEDDIDSSELSITQETPVVTAFADAGPRRQVGNYDYSLSADGKADFAASQSDATLFGLIGSSGVAMGWDPTGSSAGANDPNYDSTSIVLQSYTMRGAIGGAVEFVSVMAGNAAISRAVS